MQDTPTWQLASSEHTSQSDGREDLIARWKSLSLMIESQKWHPSPWPNMSGASYRGGGRVREFGTNMHTLLYLKWKTNKDLL